MPLPIRVQKNKPKNGSLVLSEPPYNKKIDKLGPLPVAAKDKLTKTLPGYYICPQDASSGSQLKNVTSLARSSTSDSTQQLESSSFKSLGWRSWCRGFSYILSETSQTANPYMNGHVASACSTSGPICISNGSASSELANIILPTRVAPLWDLSSW